MMTIRAVSSPDGTATNTWESPATASAHPPMPEAPRQKHHARSAYGSRVRSWRPVNRVSRHREATGRWKHKLSATGGTVLCATRNATARRQTTRKPLMPTAQRPVSSMRRFVLGLARQSTRPQAVHPARRRRSSHARPGRCGADRGGADRGGCGSGRPGAVRCGSGGPGGPGGADRCGAVRIGADRGGAAVWRGLRWRAAEAGRPPMTAPYGLLMEDGGPVRATEPPLATFGNSPGSYLAAQVGVAPVPVPVPWKPNSVHWPAVREPL